MTPWFAFGGSCVGVWLGAWWLWRWAKTQVLSYAREKPELLAARVALSLEEHGVTEVPVVVNGSQVVGLPVRDVLVGILCELSRNA